MIESIEIKNFRCFKDTKIAKFGLVNLIGGMNNAGKTALLEAVYLAYEPNEANVLFTYNIIRKENTSFAKEKPQNTWDNFFFSQDKTQNILITLIDNESKHYDVTFSCDERMDEQADSDNENLNELDVSQIYLKSFLHIESQKNLTENKTATLVSSKSGISPKFIHSPEKIHFIPSSTRVLSSRLAIEYEKARFDDDKKKEELLNVFKIIDNTIGDLDVFAIGTPTLYLQRKNEKRMPISLFGDAINKVADFILRIINNRNSIILIDEIENGIHYTAQSGLWEMLFKLAIAYDTQIFATSHSFEMIKAFAKVAQEFPDKAAYFEMARHAKTGNIIGSSIPIDILNYDIENHAPFRGE